MEPRAGERRTERTEGGDKDDVGDTPKQMTLITRVGTRLRKSGKSRVKFTVEEVLR